LRRVRAREDLTADLFHKPATLVRRFVEDYHEKLEEKFIFPAFEESSKELVDLVSVLRRQHDAGRKLTDVILRDAETERFQLPDVRDELMRTCEAFIRMYRPHAAREETVLFPALYSVVGAKRVKQLGEQFEDKEHRLFGEEGFEKAVKEVAE